MTPDNMTIAQYEKNVTKKNLLKLNIKSSVNMTLVFYDIFANPQGCHITGEPCINFAHGNRLWHNFPGYPPFFAGLTVVVAEGCSMTFLVVVVASATSFSNSVTFRFTATSTGLTSCHGIKSFIIQINF